MVYGYGLILLVGLVVCLIVAGLVVSALTVWFLLHGHKRRDD